MKFIVVEKQGGAHIVELDEIDYIKIRELLKLKNDRCFEVVNRKIGKHNYDIYLDDAGLLDGTRYLTGVCYSGGPSVVVELLVGNLLIAKSDNEGNTIGLSDFEINEIMFNLMENEDSCKEYGDEFFDEKNEAFVRLGDEGMYKDVLFKIHKKAYTLMYEIPDWRK